MSQQIEQLLDQLFGKQSDVRTLVSQEKWEEAALFGDGICHNAVVKDENWIWEQISNITKDTDTRSWNSCSWGNAAIFIHRGSDFPHRITQINNLKEALASLA